MVAEKEKGRARARRSTPTCFPLSATKGRAARKFLRQENGTLRGADAACLNAGLSGVRSALWMTCRCFQFLTQETRGWSRSRGIHSPSSAPA